MRTHIFAASVLIALTDYGGAPHPHAMLASASPPVGGSVGAAPHQVTLSFTQGLEPAFSSVQMTDSKGARVDGGKAQVSGSSHDRRDLQSVVARDLQSALARALRSIRTRRKRKLLLPCRPVIGPPESDRSKAWTTQNADFCARRPFRRNAHRLRCGVLQRLHRAIRPSDSRQCRVASRDRLGAWRGLPGSANWC